MSSAAAILSLCATGAHENMNTGGAYLIAKSDGTPNQDWNTSFTLRKNAEYFDVYAGPISTVRPLPPTRPAQFASHLPLRPPPPPLPSTQLPLPPTPFTAVR